MKSFRVHDKRDMHLKDCGQNYKFVRMKISKPVSVFDQPTIQECNILHKYLVVHDVLVLGSIRSHHAPLRVSRDLQSLIERDTRCSRGRHMFCVSYTINFKSKFYESRYEMEKNINADDRADLGYHSLQL